MKNKEIEKRINNIVSKSVPDKYNYINKNKEKGFIFMEDKKKNNYFYKVAFAVLFIGIFLGSYVFYTNNYKLATIVGLDVNPSLKISLNKKNKVIEVKSLNEDGKNVLDGMNLKGSDITIAVNAIVGSMYKNGYINDLENSILISVDGKNAKVLEDELLVSVNKTLSDNKINPSIITQKINSDQDIEKMAETYKISKGKALLISKIIKNNTLLKIEDLVNLNINELNLLLNNNDIVNVLGTASDKKYIGKEKALEIAKNHSKCSTTNNLEVDFDFEFGKLVYEIEFKCNNYEYEYDIDALNGNIIKNDKENDNNKNLTSNYISKEKALSIALNNASIKDYYDLEIVLDDNKYEIEFTSNNIEYEYEINALNGNIIKNKKENKKHFN